jgi:hypothetical protein
LEQGRKKKDAFSFSRFVPHQQFVDIAMRFLLILCLLHILDAMEPSAHVTILDGVAFENIQKYPLARQWELLQEGSIKYHKKTYDVSTPEMLLAKITEELELDETNNQLMRLSKEKKNKKALKEYLFNAAGKTNHEDMMKQLRFFFKRLRIMKHLPQEDLARIKVVVKDWIEEENRPDIDWMEWMHEMGETKLENILLVSIHDA